MDHYLSNVPSSTLGEITETLQTTLNRPILLTPETNIVADLGMDSLALMDFCMALEDRLDISIPLGQLADVVSIGDLAAAVDALRGRA